MLTYRAYGAYILIKLLQNVRLRSQQKITGTMMCGPFACMMVPAFTVIPRLIYSLSPQSQRKPD